MIRKISALLTALLLVASLPLAALAAEWNLSDGDITVSVDGQGEQYVTQSKYDETSQSSSTQTSKDSNPTITGGDGFGTITVNAKGDAEAKLTIKDINALTIEVGDSNATITVSGENNQVNNGDDVGIHVSSGDLTINGDGKLTGYGDKSYNAVIGSNNGEAMSGSITIEDDVTVTIDRSSGSGAGIGSGDSGAMSGTITIGGNAKVEGTAGSGSGAVIGTGADGKMSGSITIKDDAKVTANGDAGAGIGSGSSIGGNAGKMSGSITIEDNAKVTATGKAGAAIGSGENGSMSGTITIGGTANVNASTSHTDSYESTPGAGGEMSGKISISEKANVTATSNGTEDAIGAGTKGTVTGTIEYFDPDPAPPQPEPTEPELTEPEAESTAIYQVLNEDGISMGYSSAVKDGVLTITVKGDYARLTGSVASLATLASWGYKTITLVTDNATSTFALADLQAKDPGTYALTHSGQEVTLTLNGEALAGILK